MSCLSIRKLFCRSSSRPKNFYYSIRPMVILSRCFGLHPFSFVTNVYGEVHRTKIKFLDSIWFIVVIVMYSSFALLISTHINLASEYKTVYVLMLGEQLLIVCGLVMCVVSVIMDMVNRNRILRNAQRFQAFDMEVWKIQITK